MKVTKSLLLGAAAGLVAMSGAQAADLPVKAKPVEYVKICSAYGAGFYYIPGTDICLRVGGYVFWEAGVKGRNAAVDVIYYGEEWTRKQNYAQWRTRGMVILDARNNTAYGTLRAYAQFGVSYNTQANATNTSGANAAGNTTPSLDRAFIEFAGMTAGFTESFFSFGAAYSIVAVASLPWDWLPVLAYTAQLGNGVTATLSLEDGAARRTGTTATNFTYGGHHMPDIIANLKVAQAWGAAQIMGALHQVRASAANANAGQSDKWGYAFGGGFEVKTPQTGNPNNSFLAQAQWTKGALEYTGLNSSPVTTATIVGFTKQGGVGPLIPVTDAWVPVGPLELTKAWSAYGAYRHYWTPMLRTGFAVGYTAIDTPANAVIQQPDGTILQGIVSTIWSPVSGFDMSLDIVYSKVDAEGNGCTAVPRCNSDRDVWTAWSRIRRNF
jgi:hypothetical protein